MKRLWLLLSGVMLVVVLMGSGGCAPAEAMSGSLPSTSTFKVADLGAQSGLICSQQNVGLWVAGVGKATAIPDVALLRLGIEAQADTVAEAQREASETMDRVMKALKSGGVAESDIQTQQFSVYPVRRWFEDENKEEIIGYRVSNMVVAKIKEIDKAGRVIDAVAEAGGDLTRIENISFTVDDPTPYYKEAREKAVENAVAKAMQLADLAEIELGKPIYISEGTVYVPPVRDIYMKGEATAGAPSPTPISPGELQFQLTIQIVYEID